MAKKKAAAESAESKTKCPSCDSAPPDLSKITGDAGPRDIFPTAKKTEYRFESTGFYRKTKKAPCKWDYKGKAFPPGRVEFEIVSDEAAKRLKVKAGPSVRICLEKDKPGPLIAVDNPAEAAAIGAAFRDCMGDGSGKAKTTCSTEVLSKFRPGQNVPIAGAPKAGRRKKAPAKKSSRKARR